MADPCGYAVIVDRISHDMPFYRAFLKNAALTGTQIINNPFWWSADDKFFNYALAKKLGVAVPRTVLLPHKLFPPEINQQSLRNLQFPLDWDGIFDYVGFPAFLKPHDGGGWRDVHHVHNPDEFFRAYDSDARPVHDAAGGGELQRILPLLCGRAEGRADHALRSAASASMSAMCSIRRSIRKELLERVETDR